MAYEDAARKYLKKHIKTGRIVTMSAKGRVNTPSESKVDRMPMGVLKETFQRISAPNSGDARTAAVLQLLNPDRIKAMHKIRSPQAEQSLRKNVGRQLWRIAEGIKELVD